MSDWFDDQLPDVPAQLKVPDRSLALLKDDAIWEDDILGRKIVADHFSQIVGGQLGPLTICLNGGWGTGKTFFLHRFVAQWRKDGGQALFFNAWEDDNIEDPLIALLGQLWTLIKGDSVDEVKTGIKKCALPLIKKAGLAYFHLELSDVATPAEGAFEAYARISSCREDLRERLTKLATKIFEETNHPLLFVIDELDRCRPTFTIEMLERVKHLFSIPHMIFVLGIDCGQLRNSIKAVYGDIDAENYLHRFIDVTLMLPPANIEDYFKAIWKRHQFELRLHVQKKHEDKRKFCEVFSTMLRRYPMTLREIEVCLRTYSLLLFSNSTAVARAEILVAIGVVLRMKNPVGFQHFTAWDIPIGELVDLIFGDLHEYDSVLAGPVEFIDYLYELAWFNERGTKQCEELNRMFRALYNENYMPDADLASPYIASCFRQHDISDLKHCVSYIGGRAHGGAFNFQRLLADMADKMDTITDVRM